MTEAKSPGAVAALGASEIDRLGRRVDPENKRQESLASTPAMPAAGDRGAHRGTAAECPSARSICPGPAVRPESPATTAVVDGAPMARTAIVQARFSTPEQRRADVAAAQEFHQIQRFVAACRRQWPGAMIVLWPDGVPTGANAPINPNPAPGEHSRAAVPALDRRLEEAGNK